mmetsp:Transcript_15495/g.44523  ORF Transcript_15495/g.44523 Transcript_15495/m.44523 type:complete len:454 (-) Transcript_15495:11-1372(-)
MPLVAGGHSADDLVVHHLVVHLVLRQVADHAAAEHALLRRIRHLGDVECLEGVAGRHPHLERWRRRGAAVVARGLGRAALEGTLLQRGGLRRAAAQQAALAVRPRARAQDDAATVDAGVHPAGLLLQVVLRPELVPDAVPLLVPAVRLRGGGPDLRGHRGLVAVHREGRVPHRGAVPRRPRGEDVATQRADQRVNVGHTDPSAAGDAEGPEEPRHVLRTAPAGPDPLRDERQHLGLGGDGQVVPGQDHLNELDRQLRPARVVCDAAQVPPLPHQRAHELPPQLVLVGRVQRGEVVEVEEHVRVEVRLDVLQAQVHDLVDAVLVRQGEEAGDAVARDVDVARVDESDQLDELVDGLRDNHLPRDGLAQGHLHAEHLVEVRVLHEDEAVAAEPHDDVVSGEVLALLHDEQEDVTGTVVAEDLVEELGHGARAARPRAPRPRPRSSLRGTEASVWT